jgi:MarR family transcriptional repressor of emrRAB
MEALMQDLGVSAPEGHLISFVGAFGPSSVRELIRVFGYRKPTMTSILNKLEERGYLRRTLNPADRRSLLVELTDYGAEVAQEARRRVEDLDAVILSRVSESDIEGFHTVLEAVAEVTGVTVRASASTTIPNHPNKE